MSRLPVCGRHAAALALAVLVVASSPAASVFGQAALTNDSILRLVRAGVPETVIVGEIDGAPTAFDVLPEALARLEREGVSDRVLEAMRRAAARSQPPPRRVAAEIVWNRLGLAIGPLAAATGTGAAPGQAADAAAVVDLVPRGAAASVGVQRGDLLVRVNGQRVRSPAHALAIIARAAPAQMTRLTVGRRGREVDIAVPPASDGDIAPPPPWATAVPGREVYSFLCARAERCLA